ncbi:hypothetical protein CALVIDRAFT_354482 [Calocera viscosa TUFC12733]|uniref:Uncharacterized protein n=1 Tax=Calocera viscosa (strain TUFC12733) TaxID=1330018 RepID=A0A167QCT7_CALVF|nr:hypothetical protein CALVIDRAFT_354482 [Calocera viscosa TUFC12733]
MFFSRISSLGLVSFAVFASVAIAAPLSVKSSVTFDVGVDMPCLLGCNITTHLSILGNLNSKVSKDLSAIASVSASTDIDLSGLTQAYDALVDDLNVAVKDLGVTTAITAYGTGAYLDAVGNTVGNLLVAVLGQAGTDVSVPGIDATLDALNKGLVGLVDNLNTDLGAAVLPLIANTTGIDVTLYKRRS